MSQISKPVNNYATRMPSNHEKRMADDAQARARAAEQRSIAENQRKRALENKIVYQEQVQEQMEEQEPQE